MVVVHVVMPVEVCALMARAAEAALAASEVPLFSDQEAEKLRGLAKTLRQMTAGAEL